MSKKTEEIARQTEEFLANGGEIEVIRPQTDSAPSPWTGLGTGVGLDALGKQGDFADSRYHRLGDGGYLTKPQHLED